MGRAGTTGEERRRQKIVEKGDKDDLRKEEDDIGSWRAEKDKEKEV